MIIVVEKQSNQITVQKQVVLRVRILEFNLPSGITNQVFTQKGEILVGSGDGTYIVFPPGSDGTYLKYDSTQPGGLIAEVPTFTVNDVENKLLNGGFILAQRQAPGTLTTIADGGYGPDRWKCYRENADLQYRRVDASGETDLTSNYYGEFKKLTNAGKFLICQPLENLDTLRFRGSDLSFQIDMKSSAARTMRMAIVELQTGGTADTIPAVVSSWNADSTDPTLGTNLAVIGTPMSCAVTTSWQTFQFTGTFPTNSKNLLVMIWSNADVAVNDTVSMAEAGLYYGTALRSWSPRPVGMEIQLCQRYYWKTFALDTAPAQNVAAGAFRFVSTKAGAAAIYFQPKDVPVRQTTPTITTFNPNAANAQARDADAGADCSSISVTYSGSGFLYASCVGAAGTGVGSRIVLHFTVDAEL